MLVIIVYTNRYKELVTIKEAYSLCRDNEIKGRIVDALTVSKWLQDYLRTLIDN